MNDQNVFFDNQEIIMNYDSLKKNNQTKPILSKYEKTSVIGLRAQQLANGAPPLINIPKHITSTIEIAEIELRQRKIPFIIRRKFGSEYEYWKVEDLNF